MEQLKLAVLSTGHVSEETAHIFNSQIEESWPVCGGKYSKYGWFMGTHCDDPDVPADLQKVFDYLLSKGIFYVLFDCDVETTPDLPVYDW